MGNSVIYRPAYEAEVEYLESTGTQYIDTGITLSNYDGFEIRYSPTQASTFIGNSEVIGSRNPEDSAVVLGFNANDSTTRNIGCRVYIRWGTLAISANPSSIASIDEWYTANVNVSNRIASDGLGNSVTLDDIPQSTNSLCIFAGRQESSGIVYAKVKIAYCKFYSNSILVSDFIPVRIGSIGYMYDKVTKQFFANKGTGNFVLGNDVSNAVIPQQRCVLYFGNQRSVVYERIYEEYQWLKTTLNSRGTYMALPINSDNLSFKRIISSVANSSWMVTNGFSYFSYSTTGDKPLAISCWDSNQSESVFWLYKKFDEEIEVVSTSNSLTFGGTSAGQYGYPIQNVRFSNGINGTSEFKTSSIYVDGVERYIPCKLLQSIPAILDGNGIARQAGECGMWDKVSNRFYGNVANSGTFTVKNPKCYEEYKWLCGRNGAYIDTNYYPIVGTDVFSVHFHYDGTMRNPDGVEQCIFGCQNGPYGSTAIRAYINGANNLAVNYCNTRDNYFPQTGVFSNNWEITDLKLDGSNFSFVANGVTYSFSNNNIQIETMPNPIWVFKKIQVFNSNCYFHGDIAYFKITDTSSNVKMHLVPCKLIHGIPASMDANGIARPAGTCGMWDKVNDKFYGNVASNGTFSVSDDQ